MGLTGTGGGQFGLLPLGSGAPRDVAGQVAAGAQSPNYVTYCTVEAQKPWWRTGPNAYAWQYVMGSALDELYDRMLQARAVAYPNVPSTAPSDQQYACPSDALYYLGAERGLERVPIESEAQWRERLRTAWGIWTRAGTEGGTREEFSWFGMLNVGVYRRHELSTPPPVGSEYVRAFAKTVWSQFDVLVQQPHPWRERLWGSPPPWGTGTWGSTMTTAEAEYLRRQGREFRSGHDTLTYIYVAFGLGRLWGAGKWGDGGLWGASGNTMAIVVGEGHWGTRGLL